MTAYTLHLPDDLAARLAELPAEEVNAAAARALAELLPASKEGKVIDEVPVIVFPNEDPDDHLTDAERAAVREGISRGLADSRAGRVTPLAEWAASKLRQFDRLGTDHGAA
jgi:predicted transcriptional regulator